MATLQDIAEQQDFKRFFLVAIVTSMVFVVGLFWNEAIKAAIESIMPARDEVSAKFLAAMIVTAVAVFAIFVLHRSMKIAQAATKGIVSQALKLKAEFEKKQKELEKRMKKLDTALERAGRKL